MNVKRDLPRVFAALLLCAILAPILSVGALAVREGDPLLYAELSGEDLLFDFTPSVNSEYTLCVFSRDGEAVHAEAELIENGAVVMTGSGSGALFSAWLAAGSTYDFRLRGSGNAVIEVARRSLSRCYENALPVEAVSSNGKMIARAYDAHWYSFEAAESGRIALSCVPDDRDLHLSALAFDENGALIADFRTLDDGACLLFPQVREGEKTYIRVSSPEGETGYYYLNLRSVPAEEETLRFRSALYHVGAGSALELSEELIGDAALWSCGGTEAAQIDQSGRLLALRPGRFEVRAYGFGSEAVCTIVADFIPLEALYFSEETLSVPAGDGIALPLRFEPGNASERIPEFSCDDPSIASVGEDGLLYGMTEGDTVLYARCGDLTASVNVRVTPAVCKTRALLVGEQNYPAAVNTARSGSENSVNAIASLLGTMDVEDRDLSVETACDLSKAELIAKIRRCFEGAAEKDVSLLYVTCHGSYRGGMSFLELSDGSLLSARDLERELRGVKGTIILMLDCCGSGGAIGRASENALFTKGIADAFALPAFGASRCKVIASAGLDQDSFRIAFNENADTGMMATVFARALCDGAGWNIDENTRGAMNADTDFDGCVTVAELGAYMRSRVGWYLDIAAKLTGTRYAQEVQLYPEGDPYILFKR